MGWESHLDRLRRLDRPELVVVPEIEGAPRSVALLAGSFDPITVGHAAMAEAASSHGELVALVYSVRTLPKEEGAPPPLLDEPARLSALETFCSARGYALALSSHGLLAEQVEAAAGRFPVARLFVVVGSDKVLQLLDPAWYDDRDATLGPMFERAEVLYAMRAGDEEAVRDALEAHPRWRDRFRRLDVAPDVARISSRRVRELVRAGQDVSALVPPEARDAVLAAGPA